MIEVFDLTKTYGAINALTNVSFKVEKGQIVGFLGANGAGKTTTMDILCGVHGADQGRAEICGHDILSEPLKAKAHIGYLPDEPPLYYDMRVKDYIEFAATINAVPKNKVNERVNYVIERLALGTVSHRLVGNLSKGFRQRVGLAQAIVHDPDVLILDEPTEGLDPNQIVQIRELIQSLKGEHTILLSSHILSEVQNTCEHIIIIDKGKILETGTYEDIVSRHQHGSGCKIKLAQPNDGLISELESQGFISKACAGATADIIDVTFAGENETSLRSMMQYIVGQQLPVVEINSKSSSLEEIFIEITQ